MLFSCQVCIYCGQVSCQLAFLSALRLYLNLISRNATQYQLYYNSTPVCKLLAYQSNNAICSLLQFASCSHTRVTFSFPLLQTRVMRARVFSYFFFLLKKKKKNKEKNDALGPDGLRVRLNVMLLSIHYGLCIVFAIIGRASVQQSGQCNPWTRQHM